MTFWSVHTHSRYSANDALPQVPAIVDQGVKLGYPALGLTDHGNPAGVVQLYKACRKAGIEPLPGTELYLTPDHAMRIQRSNHLTVVAYSEAGYRNLVRLTTLANANFYYRPRVDLADFADLAENGYTEGLAVGTGCRSGLVTRTMLSQGVDRAARLVEALAGWFPRVYVEVMNHGIDADGVTDDEIVSGLVEVAAATSLPMIVTSDAHYTHPDDQVLHNWLKTLVAFSDDPTEGQFSGEGYHLVDEAWLRSYLEPHVLAAGLAGLDDLLSVAKVRIPELDTFTLKVPDVTLTGDPFKVLEGRVFDRLDTLELTGTPELLTRATDELDVIAVSDMAGYLLFVAGLCDFMRERKIWYHARGSVTGSYVTWLLQISQQNPVYRRIRFERFLSGDRTTPPDIDLDIDHSRRDEVVAELKRRCATRQVCTYGSYRLDEDDDEQKGSLRVRYFAVQRKYRNVGHSEQVPGEDWEKLKALAGLELVRQAGTHPAGFLIAETDEELDTLPMARIDSTGNLVTAYDKDDVEPFGYPKIDLLGLKTLQALQIACTIAHPDDPEAFYASIPEDDPETMRLIASGNTAGLFQLEGYSQRKGCEQLAPSCVDDVIAMQALYRTGVSKEFLDTYLARRRGAPVPPMHPTITAELAESHGVAIYQEQVVGVLRSIGMPPAELTAMLKAVKNSGRAGIEKAKIAVEAALPGILGLARTAGWGDSDVDWLTYALTDYAAGYSFGKAHSVQYGVVAYRTGYLRVHYPQAFWTGVLTAYTGHKDIKKRDVEKMYRRSAAADGITVLPPHVNHSGVHYRVEGDAIRIGLTSVKYVKGAAPEIAARAPFTSLRDLGERCNANRVSGCKRLAVGDHPKDLGETTATYALWAAKAFDGLPAGTVPARDVQVALSM